MRAVILFLPCVFLLLSCSSNEPEEVPPGVLEVKIDGVEWGAGSTTARVNRLSISEIELDTLFNLAIMGFAPINTEWTRTMVGIGVSNPEDTSLRSEDMATISFVDFNPPSPVTYRSVNVDLELKWEEENVVEGRFSATLADVSDENKVIELTDGIFSVQVIIEPAIVDSVSE